MKQQGKKKYYYLQKQTLEEIKGLKNKPSLLMHVCCGVCASHVSLCLSEYLNLTLYYNNDNIYPKQEYDKRYQELVRLIDEYNKNNKNEIKIIKTEYDGENYCQKLEPLADEPEKGKRCLLCYFLRMKQAMQYASDNGFEYFTTVMTVSRQKDSVTLNEIGQKIAHLFPKVKYFYSDFKKNDGILKTNQLVKKYGLYRQQYCGCIYSYNDYIQRKERGNKK
jgi:predicted adenine nucleotide alpha hydrolase (AANH) superfamily ATPase